MAIENNIRLLDMDERDRAARETAIPQDIKDFAEKYDLTIDLATSDVVVYLYDELGGTICLG